jgi:hypothetical protein
MANSLLMGYEGSTSPLNLIKFSSTSQAFFTFTGTMLNSQVPLFAVGESAMQIAFQSGTLSNLWCRVNGAATSTSTVVLRQNAANGNETISVTANTTGAFSDAVNIDTTNGGDLLCIGVTPVSTAFQLTITAATFAATTNTYQRMICFASPNIINHSRSSGIK